MSKLMGTLTSLLVNEYPILYEKNQINHEIVNLIFQPDDFVVERRPIASQSTLMWGDEIVKEKGSYLFKGYKQKVKVCIDRLKIYGYNEKSARNDFNAAKKISDIHGDYSFDIKKISYKKYSSTVSELLAERNIDYNFAGNTLSNALINNGLSIFGQSTPSVLFTVLKASNDESLIEYDFSNVVESGWVKLSDCKAIANQKILILTEGRTDAEFISSSLNLLYPYLTNYYHFINFDEFKIESNSSALVRMILTFCAAKVEHPMIAIFDNDTAGIAEMKRVQSVKLPSNIRIMKLPDIKIAKRYPTLGPTGLKHINVNGLACGIEMYLGSVLVGNGGNYFPIQWKGYNEKEKKYQGEVVQKNAIQEAFREKIRSGYILTLPEMDQVLQSIFDAFTDSQISL